MKNIIKTAICLIVISSILLYSSISYAATTQEITLSFPNYANNVNYISSEAYEENGTFYNYYTYEFKIIPYIQTSVDTYKNGYFNIRYTVDNHIPTGCTLVGINFSYDDTYTDTVISFISKNGTNAARQCYVVYYLKNCGLESTIPTGELTCTVTFKAANASWASLNINPTFTAVVGNNHVYANAQPEMLGMAAIIKNAVTEALEDGELDAIYDYLVLWKTTQDGYLADLELGVNDLNADTDTIIQWITYINTVQVSMDQKLNLIKSLLDTFPGQYSQMIQLLTDLKNMNASDTAAESQMQNAEQQLSQAVNDMEVQKPNINNVVNAGDQYMDSNITGAQGDTFFWLHGTNIFVTILTMAVTIGILGFVIYGKSG